MTSASPIPVLDDIHYMRLALREAAQGLHEGEYPFGAVLVDTTGRVVCSTHDTVERDNDYTSHAETMLVKMSCKLLGRDLAGCTLYTTVEPCPMCFTTSWLAKVSRIVFGASMAEVNAFTKGLVRELQVPASDMNRLGSGLIDLAAGVMRDQCLGAFAHAKRQAPPLAPPVMAHQPGVMG
jgi:tRNA(adenine34) deaminase